MWVSLLVHINKGNSLNDTITVNLNMNFAAVMGKYPLKDLQLVPKITAYLLLLCIDPNKNRCITEDEGFKLPITQASAAFSQCNLAATMDE